MDHQQHEQCLLQQRLRPLGSPMPERIGYLLLIGVSPIRSSRCNFGYKASRACCIHPLILYFHLLPCSQIITALLFCIRTETSMSRNCFIVSGQQQLGLN
ncbi:hypothetical protein BRADI_2g15981v3 [Brachypodium distachyon]|uniref:Uncharacterized protein n=1 Tax=Brachypodium distachyon TaxID=15368 RepID=A0A2K2D8S0_BRADI|nr:hypothetical protein BRADI_2g15981v3 [Brachypodium distachyon]